ncbi:syndecan-3-like isoform X2 [Clarias gariepinus]|uniref:syndecan-3-like isoform X2 n=1 Tax=Clarias gariepinus TaxID=13013 RepID=UPI00234CB8AE|nr:syndecan-3-like isoform X2 [Clarias gariepinus]
MRLHSAAALVVYLCLWIPVAHANEAPEDQDASGDDDEFSASGSGDDDIWIDDPVKTTQASPNATEAAWFTTPDAFPEDSTTTTPFIVLDNKAETSGDITEAFLPRTTEITGTEAFLPRSTENTETEAFLPRTTEITETERKIFDLIKPLGEEGETTTVNNEEQPETTTVNNEEQPETTQPPALEPPVVPTSDSSNIEPEEEETMVYKEPEPVATEAPDMETTPLVLSTTSESNLADTEASGDAVESTTVETNFIEDTISDKGQPVVESKQPTLTDVDFEIDNEIKPRSQPGSGSDSEYARGSDNDSLLERKEVLAGVIAGGVVGLAFAIMLVSLMVYRMKKKDEGSYSLDEHKHPNGGYQKPQKQEEFLA